MLRSSKSLSPAVRPRMHPDYRSCACVQAKYQWTISDYRFVLCSLSCLFMCWIKIFFSHLYLLKQSEYLDQFNRVLHSFPLAVSVVRYIRLGINPLFVLFWGASSGSVGEQVAIYNISKSGMHKIASNLILTHKGHRKALLKPLPEQDGSRCLQNGTVPAEGGRHFSFRTEGFFSLKCLIFGKLK